MDSFEHQDWTTVTFKKINKPSAKTKVKDNVSMNLPLNLLNLKIRTMFLLKLKKVWERLFSKPGSLKK